MADQSRFPEWPGADGDYMPPICPDCREHEDGSRTCDPALTLCLLHNVAPVAAEGTDELREALARHIADTCPVWEAQFDGGPGLVVSVSDASFAAAKFLSGESRG